ncbi:MAG: hypothetical protein AVDCRST_MAG68-3759, partial [uncultured Gemmatimonadetes bacterium]
GRARPDIFGAQSIHTSNENAPVPARRTRGALRSVVRRRAPGAGERPCAAEAGGRCGRDTNPPREAGRGAAERGEVGADHGRGGERAGQPLPHRAGARGAGGAARADAAGPRALLAGDDRWALGAEHRGGAPLAAGARGTARDRRGGFGDDGAAGGAGGDARHGGAPARAPPGGRARAVHPHPVRHLRAGPAGVLVLRVADGAAHRDLPLQRRGAAPAQPGRQAGQPPGRRQHRRPPGEDDGRARARPHRRAVGVGERALRARDERGGAHPLPLPHHAGRDVRSLAAGRFRRRVDPREPVVALPAAHPGARAGRPPGRAHPAGPQQRGGQGVDEPVGAALRHPRDEVARDDRLRDLRGVRAAHQLGRALPEPPGAGGHAGALPRHAPRRGAADRRTAARRPARHGGPGAAPL